jgi:hypothetical protein
LTDTADPDSSEHENEDDDSRPAKVVNNKPVPRKASRKTGRGSARSSRRSSANRSRSASPTGTRVSAWLPEEDEKLREQVVLKPINQSSANTMQTCEASGQ